MQTHLTDYAEFEKRYGHSTQEFREQKIASVEETIVLLETMKLWCPDLANCQNGIPVSVAAGWVNTLSKD